MFRNRRSHICSRRATTSCRSGLSQRRTRCGELGAADLVWKVQDPATIKKVLPEGGFGERYTKGFALTWIRCDAVHGRFKGPASIEIQRHSVPGSSLTPVIAGGFSRDFQARALVPIEDVLPAFCLTRASAGDKNAFSLKFFWKQGLSSSPRFCR